MEGEKKTHVKTSLSRALPAAACQLTDEILYTDVGH